MVSKRILGVGVLWLGLALAFGASGVLSRAPVPLFPAVLWALVAAVLIAFWRSPAFRAWATGIDIRWLIAIHLTRFVGFYFLYLYERGELPYAFAVPGGWGDIAVAVGATVLLLIPPRSGAFRPAGVVWNVLGLLDILFVVATAARLAFADRDSMAAVTHLPLSLLPTFLVPLIIASHVIMLVRLLGARRA
jgi:hypothetical protein